MKVVLAGGGTGGHVYPAIAIAQALAADPAFAPLEVTFVGTREGLEARIVPRAGYALRTVYAAPLRRRLGLGFVRTLIANLAGTVQALLLLRRLQPDLLVATGGYAALPVLLAMRLARALRLGRGRIAVLEPNAAAGLTNRLAAPLADEVWLGVAPGARPLRRKEVLTGTPVRTVFAERVAPGDARRALGLAADRTTVVVLGGSQGARRLNEAVLAFAERGFPEALQVLLVTGTRDFDEVARRAAAVGAARLKVVAYLDNPCTAYSAADLVVARAGASTLAELAALGVPALLVPYPHATGDHQRHNAEALVAAGAARIAADADFDGARLAAELDAALAEPVLGRLRAAAGALAARDPAANVRARVKAWNEPNASAP